jgi:shikimate dehydrogenase
LADKKYLVLGDPISHSISPMIHQAFARQFNLSVEYTAHAIKAHALPKFLSSFIASGGNGLNITAPYKELMYRQISKLSSRAQQARAVNTITVLEDGSLHGDNTDGIGFIRDLTQRHAISIKEQRILILGAGGAVRGILSPILDLQPHSITIVNRDLNKAAALAADFATYIKINIASYAQLVANYDLIINATSASLHSSILPIPKTFSFFNCNCYDLNRGDKSSQFLNLAQAGGAKKTIHGLGMLVEQAAEAFYLWHKVFPDTNSVIEQLHAKSYQI